MIELTVLAAFTVEQASRVTGVSERRIRYWDRTSVLSPSLSAVGDHRHAYNRIYSFRDIVGLRTLGILRDRFELPLQQLRAVGAYLRTRVAAPWSELRFHVAGTGRGADILFRDKASGHLVSTKLLGQAVLIEVEPIAADMEQASARLVERQPDQIGQIERNRYVLGNRTVLAGTRVPTLAVWEFHAAGYDTDYIIRQYPRLTQVDVASAIDYEVGRRQVRAR